MCLLLILFQSRLSVGVDATDLFDRSEDLSSER